MGKVSATHALIAHVNLAREFRGGERQTLLLMRELAARGRPQRLVARRDSELAERAAAVPGLEIRRLGRNPLDMWAATRGARIAHAHEARAVYVALVAHRLNGAAMVITRRVTRPQKPSLLRDYAYRSAGAVVAISGAVERALGESYPEVTPVRIPSAHARLPVDAAASAAIRDRYAGKILIGHTGTYYHPAKGQLTIIEAAHRAASEQPDWHFLLMGAGRHEQLFRERIGDLPNIELTGFVDNVGDYLAALDVFVFPSPDEALGSSLIDALQFGLPIVATRVGGIPELVEDGVNGILIEPESPGQLFDGIRRLAVPSPATNAMQIANRAKAESFSAEKMADAYEALYARLLERP
ncbi:MAG TPA: glycosyltransferase family 4 protein [Woeseiaceae bacterium]|nr:glycosyltransferase family 4 protein [Woeseiaceae bacterium]